MAEYPIGATELRQKLTDVIQQVREQNATYIVETFGRPQVVIMSLDAYRQLQRDRRLAQDESAERAVAAFGLWSERPELDDAWLTAGREQWQSKWVPAVDDDNG